ncbi:MAG: hypothetical protein HC880_14330 [Bacteroidia bacterium]|nr:hypothetical protein [Bacteroidia bacterium]
MLIHLKKALQDNEKGINDLISQDLSASLWACYAIEHPEVMNLLEDVLQQSYRNSCRLLEELLLSFLEPEAFSAYEQDLKATLQTFVYSQVEKKREEIYDKINRFQSLSRR